jgi:predicted DNA-binding transcriptional regulator YafY
LISTYGLDRISKLKITKDKFRYSHDFDHQIYFKHAYGITTFEGKPEVIHLSLNTSYGQYVLNQPLHETQKTLIDDENEIRISLELGITPELIQDILGMGANVKVLQPAVLVKQIQKNLSQTLGQYK